VTPKRGSVVLLFIASFALSIIYGPRYEIADYTALICSAAIIIYFAAPAISPEVNDKTAEIIDTAFWTTFTAFVLASFVRGFGLGYIFDNIFLDFSRLYFP